MYFDISSQIYIEKIAFKSESFSVAIRKRLVDLKKNCRWKRFLFAFCRVYVARAIHKCAQKASAKGRTPFFGSILTISRNLEKKASFLRKFWSKVARKQDFDRIFFCPTKKFFCRQAHLVTYQNVTIDHWKACCKLSEWGPVTHRF